MLDRLRNLRNFSFKINLPSALPIYPVSHSVEYRSDESPLPVPGIEQREYRSRTTALLLDPAQHATHASLVNHFMNEFHVEERPGHHAIVYWCNNGPVSAISELNELTPSAPLRDLLMAECVRFIFVYIPIS